MAASPRRQNSSAAVPAALLCILLLLTGTDGQGLRRSATLAASQAASESLAQKYFASLARARALSKWYASLSRSARAACRGSMTRHANASAMCAGFDAIDFEELAIAASPQAFSWINPKTTGAAAGVPGVATQSNPFAPVGDQGNCWTSVSFAVTAAAEASVVRALGLPGGGVRMSVQDLGFCPERKEELRFCQTCWDLLSAFAKLLQRTPVAEHCLNYTAAPASKIGSFCNYACQTLDPATAGGRFVPRQVRTLAAAQRHIRVFGGVVTAINIYNDFRPFFAANPRGVYQGKQCEGGDPSQLEAEHAVVLVGYNNTGRFWVARNSWGPKFGDNGYFRISYGTCGVGSLGDMYGIGFVPDRPRKITINVTPDVDNEGCFIYRARPGESLGSLADSWDIDVRSLILNNSGVIDSLEEPLAGKLLMVCGLANNGVVDLKTPSWMLPGNATPGLPAAVAQVKPTNGRPIKPAVPAQQPSFLPGPRSGATVLSSQVKITNGRPIKPGLGLIGGLPRSNETLPVFGFGRRRQLQQGRQQRR